METIKINNVEYKLNVDKATQLGVLIKKSNYPNWNEYCDLVYGEQSWFMNNGKVRESQYIGSYTEFLNPDEAKAFVALGKLIKLRNWVWDNVCDGWRPEWDDEGEKKHCIAVNCNKIKSEYFYTIQSILAFTTPEIRDKFLESYRDLIETAKMFL